VPFGHLGDGNVHYNVSQPVGADKAAFLALWEPMSEAIHELVNRMGGSISAEHGIGRMKREALLRFKDPVALDMMRTIKSALDPHGILNPGKVL
jgi:FAD/FMN-containing dehydrogenase